MKNAQRKLDEEKRQKQRLEDEQKEVEKERDELKRRVDNERRRKVGAESSSDDLQVWHYESPHIMTVN